MCVRDVKSDSVCVSLSYLQGSVCDEAVQSSTRRFSGSISRGVRSPDAPSLTPREVVWHAPCGDCIVQRWSTLLLETYKLLGMQAFVPTLL